ncbi:hypothetical protein V2J09_012849 [Rumex salicifolius]
MTAALSTAFPSLSSSSTIRSSPPISCPNKFVRTNFICYPTPRLRISYKAPLSNQCFHRTPPRVWCLYGGDSELNPEAKPSESSESDSSSEFSIDLKLPRRRLLVQFTCNACGDRTKRLINRLAYERGTVFVQCAGCLQHHKLVDNLGLVVEYDLRDEVQ